MNATLTKKIELNLDSTLHSTMIKYIVEKSISGITQGELIELRDMFMYDKSLYCASIKKRYTPLLGLLEFQYHITEDVEHSLLALTHDSIHKVKFNFFDEPNTVIEISVT
ncbi:hypothetical protein [Rossellomorea aquimaris]|uniref:hypothetical protein n=1 Tax=Rossellomorea aquimaris TaxID=189382 RepID=UPI0011E990AB|nr:hypothetical protein [Rossellomorea aquimaris]TYS87513.1 hypothetical protein FZC88_16085 [Rossellomorea aquimaris]